MFYHKIKVSVCPTVFQQKIYNMRQRKNLMTPWNQYYYAPSTCRESNLGSELQKHSEIKDQAIKSFKKATPVANFCLLFSANLLIRKELSLNFTELVRMSKTCLVQR